MSERQENPTKADNSEVADRAEQVREHLVALRGGAPFLSPFDAALLVDWLEAGLSVGAILRAVELAADKRRQKRSRIPLALRHARAALKAYQPPAEGSPAAGPRALDPLVGALREGDPVDRAVAARLERLCEAGLEGEALALAAIDACRWGLGLAWEEADRPALLAQAARELAGLGEDWTPAQRAQAEEEVARDLVRQRHPLLSAARVWDTVYP